MLAMNAASFTLTNLAIAIAAIIPITTMTTISSIRVKPLLAVRMRKGKKLAYALRCERMSWLMASRTRLIVYLLAFMGALDLNKARYCP